MVTELVVPVFKNRGEYLTAGDTVRLRASFRDTSGTYIDLDAFPQITIIQPSGLVSVGPTSAGIMHEDTGKYLYEYPIGLAGPLGVWTDIWQGTISGFPVQSSFNFIVAITQMPALNSDGYVALGDDPGFNYSQTAILNINKLLKTLKARLSNTGKSKKIVNGNVVYIDCEIFSVDMLVTFLATALTDFNAVPYFTTFTFESTDIIDQFHEILVEGATLQALASKALIERGREFNITDNGISFIPPTVSELLNSQYGTLLTHYYDKLKYIKNSMRPSQISLGSIRPLSANPIIAKLRHLRARRVF